MTEPVLQNDTVKLFLDTTILVDVLANRQPHAEAAIALFKRRKRGELRLCTSAISITTSWYLVSRERDARTALEAIKGMLKFVEVINTGERAVLQALKADFRDFEDGVQYYSAFEAGDIQCIITRNVRDFRHSVIPVYSARDYLELKQDLN